jgi:hypothetical protein
VRTRDDVLKRIGELLASPELEQVLREHDEPKPKPKPPPDRRRRRGSPPERDRRSLEEKLLLQFTPASAFEFIVERTVAPATEDGLVLLASYPELSAAAPELVADMAVAFRVKERHEYPKYFALVAAHHGLVP